MKVRFDQADSPIARASVLFLLFAGAFARCPPILLHGRVWAEESSVFLTQNWHLPFSQILVAPHLGYYSFWCNAWVATAIRWVPLKFASYLFTSASMLVLLAVGYFLYETEFLPSFQVKLAGVAALLFTAGSIESWLNLINAQFYFALLAAIILASQSNRLPWQRTVALAICILSSPVAAILAPLFLWRALRESTRIAWLQAALMTCGSAAQAAVTLRTNTGNRTLHFSLGELGPILFNKDVVFPLLGRPIAVLTGRAILRVPPTSMPTCWLLLGLAAVSLGYILRKNRSAILLAGAALWLGTCEALLALGGGLLNAQPGFGERYALAPNCLLVLALLAAVSQPQEQTKRRWTYVLLGLAFIAGFIDYLWLPFRVPSNFDAKPWHTQAVQWERDETLPLQPNPDGWSPLRLPHRH